MTDGSSPPSGWQPWDAANGLRVGILAGGLIGVAVIALTNVSSFWIVVACGVVGGGIGFWSGKRRHPA